MRQTALSLNILFSILILLLAARMLADIASYKLGGQSTVSGTASSLLSTKPQPPRITALQSYAIILENGLFGPATKGVLTPLAQQATSTAPATSQSDLVLLGTATGSPRTSFVLIRRTSSNEERVFRIGEKIFDLGVLRSVQKESAEVTAGGQIITLRTPSAPPEVTKPSTAVSTGVVQATPNNTGIIDQRALNAALDNIGQAMTDARLLPSMKDGRVEGFRTTEVKPQGVFAAVGLKNGDILMKINEFPIDSPEKAIQSFMTLKGQNHIKLDLLRDGAPTSLEYDIR